MSVRAKFTVTGIRRSMSTRQVSQPGEPYRSKPCELQTIELSPVCGNGDPAHENTQFWQASPSGKIELGCINLEAASQFHLGSEYYVDFTPAD